MISNDSEFTSVKHTFSCRLLSIEGGVLKHLDGTHNVGLNLPLVANHYNNKIVEKQNYVNQTHLKVAKHAPKCNDIVKFWVRQPCDAEGNPSVEIKMATSTPKFREY